ncbi:MAG: YggS family pyridoxal phosphate-dependent enzyme [Mangrovibacterium sp.]
MGIADQIIRIKAELGEGIRLVAVSKTRPAEDLLEAYRAGQRIFGENKVQELTGKHGLLPEDVEWHFIGHLQTNKVRFIAPFISLIHSVDSFKLLRTIDREGRKNKRRISCLLQFHIAREESKYGFSMTEAREMFASADFAALEHVDICGVMGMATNTFDQELVRAEFRELKSIFGKIKQDFFGRQNSFSEISMGMSGDYPLAVEEGSTLVRVGSLIFGERKP